MTDGSESPVKAFPFVSKQNKDLNDMMREDKNVESSDEDSDCSSGSSDHLSNESPESP